MSVVPAWIQVLQALLTPAVAIAVGVIGFLQWRTAHQKVILDLFDRRLALYDAVMELHAQYRSSATPDGAIKTIARSLGKLEQKAKFLLGDEVAAAIGELPTTMWKVLPYLVKYENEIDDGKRSQILREAQEVEKGISDWRRRFPALCLPYMRMDQRMIPTPAEWVADRNRIRLSYADEKQR